MEFPHWTQILSRHGMGMDMGLGMGWARGPAQGRPADKPASYFASFASLGSAGTVSGPPEQLSRMCSIC